MASRLYGNSRLLGSIHGKNWEHPGDNIDFPCFFNVFQAQILRKYPRRSCGSFWSGLKLWSQTFDRFRHIFIFFMSVYAFLRNGDGHGNGYDHDCCGSTATAITTLTMVTIAATWWLRPRLRQLGDYDLTSLLTYCGKARLSYRRYAARVKYFTDGTSGICT